MKKVSIIIFVILLNSLSSNSQINLVPNSDFEIFINCFHSIDSCQSWHNPTAYSPDYFNSCMTGGFSVPSNVYAYEMAHSGNAYAGIIMEFPGSVGSNREYIQAELLDSLVHGKSYLVSFYVCIADSSPFAVNDIGAFFGDTAIFSNQLTYLPVTPQIQNIPLVNPLNQRDTWILVQDTIIADGGEKFITIGNFKDDANTDTSSLAGGSINLDYAYYFIDDVDVHSIDSTSGIYDAPNCLNTEQIYFDFITQDIKIHSDCKFNSISIYNLSGDIEFYHKNNIEKDFKTFWPYRGLFIVNIEYSYYTSKKKLLIK